MYNFTANQLQLNAHFDIIYTTDGKKMIRYISNILNEIKVVTYNSVVIPFPSPNWEHYLEVEYNLKFSNDLKKLDLLQLAAIFAEEKSFANNCAFLVSLDIKYILIDILQKK